MTRVARPASQAIDLHDAGPSVSTVTRPGVAVDGDDGAVGEVLDRAGVADDRGHAGLPGEDRQVGQHRAGLGHDAHEAHEARARARARAWW